MKSEKQLTPQFNQAPFSRSLRRFPCRRLPFNYLKLWRMAATTGLAAIMLLLVLLAVHAPALAQTVDFSVSKSAPASVQAGVAFTYTIRVENLSDLDINVDIVDPLPVIMTVVNNGGGVVSGGNIQWSRTVRARESTEVKFSVQINQTGVVVNSDYWAKSGLTTRFGNAVSTTITAGTPAAIAVAANPSPVTANNFTNLTFTVTDAFGNTVADNTVVTLRYSQGTIDGSAGPFTATTTAGQVVKSWQVGMLAGTAKITATANAIQGTANVTVRPDVPYSITVTSSAPRISTVSDETATITAVVRDQFNNPVTSTPVTFTTSLGRLNGTGPTVVVNTGATNGQAAATLGGTTAGTATLTVQAGSITNSNLKVYLAPGPATQISIAANPTSLTANGVSTSAITLRILDANLNPVDTATPVTITTTLGRLPGGGATYNQTTTTGQVQIPLTAITRTGTAIVRGYAAGKTTDTAVNFFSGPPSRISLTVSPPAVVADGTSTTRLTATALDSNGNVVGGISGQTITFTFASADGTFVEPKTGSTVNGILDRTLRSSTNLGTVPVTVTVSGLTTPTVGSVQFIEGPPKNIAIAYSPTPPVVAGTPVSFTITVRDIVSHILPNVPITITTSLGKITPTATGTTTAAGQLQRTLVPTRAGTTVLTFYSYNGLVGTHSVAVTPDAPAQAVLAVSPLQIIADGTSTGVITATVTDRYGNPVSGYTPAFSLSPALGTISGSGATNTAGVTSRTLRSTTALGGAFVSVTGLTTVTQALVNFVTGPVYTATLAVLETPPYYVVSNCVSGVCYNPDRVTMVITLTDRVGHPLVGEAVSVTSSLAGSTVSGSGCMVSDSSAKVTCTLYSTKSGTPTIRVSGITTTGPAILFNSGPLNHVTIAPRRTFFDPLPVQAGVPYNFTAAGYDKYSNVRPEPVTNWSAISLGGTGTVNGSGVFVGQTVGTMMVQATLAGKTDVSYVKVNPGAAAQAAVSVSPASVVADGSQTAAITLQVMDVYGNAVGSGFVPTLSTNRGAVDIIEGTGATNTGGIATSYVRSYLAGLSTIQVTNLATLTGQTTVNFIAGAPSKALIQAGAPNNTAESISLPANGTASANLTVTAVDSYGNPVGAGFRLDLVVSSGTVTCGSATTDAAGAVYCTLTAPLAAGSANVTVLYNSNPLTRDSRSDTISYVVGPLSHLAITPAGPLTREAGQATVFSAQGFDSDNAPIPGSRLVLNWFKQRSCTVPGCGDGLWSPVVGAQTTFTGTTLGVGLSLNVFATDNVYTTSTALKSASITVVAAPPVSANLAASPTSVTANGASPIVYTLTNLKDRFGNVSPEGAPITFTVQAQPAPQTASGVISGGQVRLVITSTTTAGTYPLTVRSSIGTIALTGPGSVIYVPGPPVSAQVLSANPANLVADNTGTSQVQLQLRDAFNNTVGGFSSPVVTSTLGVISGSGNTDATGVLTRTLRAGLTLGQAAISVNGIAATGQAIWLIPGPPVSATLAITPSVTVVVGSKNTTVTYTVYDNWGHLAADGTIITPTISPALGTFSGSKAAAGGVVRQVFNAGAAVGSATLGSQGLTVSGATGVTLIPGPAALALVNASPTSLKVNQTTTLNLTITDAYGNVTPPTLISITSVLGGVIDGLGATVAKTSAAGTGLISANLISTRSGTETLALVGPAGPLAKATGSKSIVFRPDNPLRVTLAPPGPVTATAGVPFTVTASSVDVYNNPVDPWLLVNYSWSQTAASGQPGYGTIAAQDALGRQVRFTPQKVGVNYLRATGVSTSSVIGNSVITVTVTPGAPAAATVTVSPKAVPADGVSTYVITVSNVTDAHGNAINSTPLTVTVQATPAVVGAGVTSGGVMVGTLPSTIKAGVHPLVVSGVNGPLVLIGDTTVTFTPGAPYRAAVSASPKSLPGDGLSASTLVVTVQDQYLNPVADGLPITVTSSLGTISSNTPTVAGKVTRTLHAPVALGTAAFTVSGPGGPLFTVGDTVTFVPGPPVYAALTALPPKLVGDGASLSRLTITIKDGNGFNVNNAKTAVISVGRGTVAPTTTVAAAGTFTATYQANTTVGPANLAVIYDGVGPLLTVGDTLEVVAGPAVSTTISASPTSLKVGTAEKSVLTISLFDAYKHPVANGTVVTVTTSLGGLLPSTSTTVNGVVTRTLTPGLTIGTATFTVKASPSLNSGNLLLSGNSVSIIPGDMVWLEIQPTTPVQVQAGSRRTFTAVGYDAAGYVIAGPVVTWNKLTSPGDGILSAGGVFTGTRTGMVGIQAAAGAIFATKNITVTPGASVTATVVADSLTVPVGGESTRLTFTARDAYGNLVADGTALSISTNLGVVSGSAKTAAGVLTRTLTSGDFPGTVDVYVNGWPAGGNKVYFAPRAWVTPTPATLVADGAGQANLSVRVVDIAGNAVPNGTSAVVTSTLGAVSNCTTTVSSVLTCKLTASLKTGPAIIYVNGLPALGTVNFTVGPAAMARIAANPASLIADGTSSSRLTITVEDGYGHVITNAGSLSVSTSLGTLGGVEPPVNGVTRRTLTATVSTTSRLAVLSVAGLTAAGNNNIHFVGTSIADGGFESGSLGDWALNRSVIWRTGGSTLAYTATVLSSDTVGGLTVQPKSGGNMVRLGATTAVNTNHADSEVRLQQQVYIPVSGILQFTFWYRILSYDVALGADPLRLEYDPFEVYLNGQRAWVDYNFHPERRWSSAWELWYLNSGTPPPPSPKDLGWKQANLTLLDTTVGGSSVAAAASLAGTVATLEFRLPNNRQAESRNFEKDNTWVYLDGIDVIYREAPVHKVYLPVVLR